MRKNSPLKNGSTFAQSLSKLRCLVCNGHENVTFLQIFLILWFWYSFLTIFGISRLIYRTIQVSSSRLRYFIIKMHIHRYFHAHGHMKHVEHYIRKCSYGDWFVLYQMSRNMNRRFFAEFLTLLSRRVNPDPEQEEDEDEEEGEDMCPPLPREKNFSVDFTADENLKKPMKPGLNKFGRKNLSSITLHSKVFDLTFDK